MGIAFGNLYFARFGAVQATSRRIDAINGFTGDHGLAAEDAFVTQHPEVLGVGFERNLELNRTGNEPSKGSLDATGQLEFSLRFHAGLGRLIRAFLDNLRDVKTDGALPRDK